MKRKKSIGLIATAVIAAMVLMPLVSATDTVRNNDIASTAIGYEGEYFKYLECKGFVQKVVNEVADSYVLETGYKNCYEKIGVEIQPSQAMWGDIIQTRDDSNPEEYCFGTHTAIVLKNLGDNNFTVVDSNWGLDRIVRIDDRNLFSWASGYGTQIHYYRLGETDYWDFNITPYTQGWEAYNVEGEESFVEDGKYFIDPAGSDPYIQLDGLLLNASTHNAFFINISSGCGDTEAMIRFNTTTSPEYGEDKEIPFYVHNDGTFNLFINFIEEDYPLWKDNITGIRIYPAKEGISGSDADIVGFESIEFIYVKPAPLPDTYVPDDYPTIQEAIDSAEEGDTIIVRDGIYTENVKVNKDYLTIKSENGAETTIVQAANLRKSVFEVTANYTEVSGFTAKSGKRGIFLYPANHCNISNNIVLDNQNGIYLHFSDGNTLINNIASDNQQGIAIGHSSGNTLRNNLMSGNQYNFGLSCCDFDNDIDTTNTVDGKPIYYIRNAENQIYGESTNAGILYCINCDNVIVKDLELGNNYCGVFFHGTENSRIENITVSDNCYGIILGSSNNNILDRNNILNSYTGVSIGSSDGNILESNTIDVSEGHGIMMSLSTENTLINNTISNNYMGAMMISLSGNILTRNSFSNNDYGIWMQRSNSNEIYLNDFTDNTDSICYYRSSSLDNIWNSPEKITYTYNGNTYENYLGNYWDDYTDIDANNDGIWDNPYSIDSDKDDYPLKEPREAYN